MAAWRGATMSTSTGITLIAAATFVGMFLFFYFTRLANDEAKEFVVGLIGGVPVPEKYRSTLLYNWFGYLVGAVVVAVFHGVLGMRVAAIVADEEVKSMAYVAATIGFGGGAFWVAAAIPEFIFYRSLLRQGESH
jgi:hypothetical protein